MRNLYVSEAAYNRSDITYYTMVLTVYKEGRATVNTHVISKLVDDDTCPVVTKLHSSQLDPDDSRRQILILKCARMYPHIMCPLSLFLSFTRARGGRGCAYPRTCEYSVNYCPYICLRASFRYYRISPRQISPSLHLFLCFFFSRYNTYPRERLTFSRFCARDRAFNVITSTSVDDDGQRT